MSCVAPAALGRDLVRHQLMHDQIAAQSKRADGRRALARGEPQPHLQFRRSAFRDDGHALESRVPRRAVVIEDREMLRDVLFDRASMHRLRRRRGVELQTLPRGDLQPVQRQMHFGPHAVRLEIEKDLRRRHRVRRDVDRNHDRERRERGTQTDRR
jgi:hypothetical protein